MKHIINNTFNSIKNFYKMNFNKIFKKIKNIKINLTNFTLFYSILIFFIFNINLLKDIYKITNSFYYIVLASIIYISLFNLFFTIVFNKFTVKTISIIILLINSCIIYFMNIYNVLIDKTMLLNVIETDIKETTELLNFIFALYLFFLGIIPSVIILKIKIKYNSFYKEFLYKIINIILTLILLLLLISLNYKNLSSYARNNRYLKNKVIPINYIFNLNVFYRYYFPKQDTFKTITDGSKINFVNKNNKKNLIIFIVGEAARSNNFSLNKYKRNTNEYLENQNLLYFNNVYSCGTATAISVPCMFSSFDKKFFDVNTKNNYENLTDFFKKFNFNLTWLDNNSSCKGVCSRMDNIINFTDKVNIKKYCNNENECFDEIMIEALKKTIPSIKEENTIIFLHQKGSHGPSYYLRYPKKFEKFKPTCKSEYFSDCTNEEILNSYDNTIYYTSYLINEIIELLKANENDYNTMLFYVSDHGQSLGENGIYLHGTPYYIAPLNQKYIPMMMWFSENFKLNFGIDENCLKEKLSNKYSHDNIFHSFLGLFNIDSSYYNANLDIFKDCRKK